MCVLCNVRKMIGWVNIFQLRCFVRSFHSIKSKKKKVYVRQIETFVAHIPHLAACYTCQIHCALMYTISSNMMVRYTFVYIASARHPSSEFVWYQWKCATMFVIYRYTCKEEKPENGPHLSTHALSSYKIDFSTLIVHAYVARQQKHTRLFIFKGI